MNGVSRERLQLQRAQIDALRASYPGLTLLHGAELNIGRDGGLDYDDGLPPHARLVRGRRPLALRARPRAADAAHAGGDGGPDGRRHRAPHGPPDRPPRRASTLDVDAVLRKAVETGIAIEINAALGRLDASSEVLLRARGIGRDVRHQHRHPPHARARAHGVGGPAGDARLRRAVPHRQPLAARPVPALAADAQALTFQSPPGRCAMFPIEPPIEPMLAKLADELPDGDGWLFEPKWDGFRAIVFRDGDEIYIQSRDLQAAGPLLPRARRRRSRASLPERCVVDGEIVIAADARARLRRAAAAAPPGRVARREARGGDAGSFVAFDLLARRRRGPARARRRPSAARGSSRRSRGARPPRAPHARDARPRASPQDWFQRFEGAGLDGVMAKHESTAVPAGQARDDQGQARAHGRLRGRRLPLAQERPGHAGRLAAARPLRRRGRAAPRRRDVVVHDGGAAAARGGARAAARGRARRPSLARRGPELADGSATRMPGAQSRWSAGKDLSWEPLRIERVVRGRSTTTCRATASATPRTSCAGGPTSRRADCRYDQLEVTPPDELADDLRRGRDAVRSTRSRRQRVVVGIERLLRRARAPRARARRFTRMRVQVDERPRIASTRTSAGCEVRGGLGMTRLPALEPGERVLLPARRGRSRRAASSDTRRPLGVAPLRSATAATRGGSPACFA